MNYLCHVEYDGTNYSGWAVQPNKVTIQGKIQEVLKKCFNQNIKVIGASRTDAHVHAYDQVFSFKENKAKLPGSKIKEVLNRVLPSDIRITKVKVVKDSFNANKDVKNKTYLYVINLNPKDAHAHNAHYIWNVYEKLDLPLMKKAAKLFMGKHNFLSFSKSELESTIRNINDISIVKNKSLLKIKVNGDGFLRNMVRMIVAFLVNIGEHKRNIKDIKKLLDNPKKGSSNDLAPASGLFLFKINY
mgnify:CR=1 FL=1